MSLSTHECVMSHKNEVYPHMYESCLFSHTNESFYIWMRSIHKCMSHVCIHIWISSPWMIKTIQTHLVRSRLRCELTHTLMEPYILNKQKRISEQKIDTKILTDTAASSLTLTRNLSSWHEHSQSGWPWPWHSLCSSHMTHTVIMKICKGEWCDTAEHRTVHHELPYLRTPHSNSLLPSFLCAYMYIQLKVCAYVYI